MDKFILGNDPMREGESRFYIIHLIDPIAIFRLEDAPTGRDHCLKFSFEGDDIVLCLHHWSGSESLDKASDLAREAWDWYSGWLNNGY